MNAWKRTSEVPLTEVNRYRFAADIFQKIAAVKLDENVIYSPASIQSCVVLAFFGADGQTADEMRDGLKLGNGNRQEIAENFGDFIDCAFKDTTDEEAASELCMANRIYVDGSLEVNPEFNEIACEYFKSEVKQIIFADSVNAVEEINAWVEQQTNNKIQNLLQPDAVDEQTSTLLINAIYFKAEWAKPFSADRTEKANFAVNGRKEVLVDTMFMDETVRYAEVPELEATALELAYDNSDLTMLILLPNENDGLQDLEQKLATIHLYEITEKLQEEYVEIYLPKFRIDFDVDLKKPLQELGMVSMFEDDADFSCLFTTTLPQKVTDIKHKAFLDVNEAGSEAAAATIVKIESRSAKPIAKMFCADHPFVFLISSPTAVFFAGHVTQP